MTNIAEQIQQVKQQISPGVKLVAISKQVPVAAIREAYAAGIRDFGESRIQETELKQAQLQDLPDITWHLIGSLQSNKARKALQLFDWIHSVDSLKLAQRLNELAGELYRYPQLCLQVKLRPDPNKQGWEPEQLLRDLPILDQCHNLKIQGLMTIAPYGLDPEDNLKLFSQLSDLAQQIRQQSWQRIRMDELSMGMSQDYQQAIQAGATMVRLGRILFGDRHPITQPIK